jgi:hypothetical protein
MSVRVADRTQEQNHRIDRLFVKRREIHALGRRPTPLQPPEHPHA